MPKGIYIIQKKCFICGTMFTTDNGARKSCGHRNTKDSCAWIFSRLKTAYFNMTRRAGSNDPSLFRWYKHVKVCTEWQESRYTFMRWALDNGYSPYLTLDRINWKGDYEPSNCRWITQKENIRNARHCKIDWINKTRVCNKCKILKTFSEFHKSNRNNSIQSSCKQCGRKKV